MGGRVKNEAAKKVYNHRYCHLCLRNECKLCHMCVSSPFQVKKNTFKVCKLT